MIFYKLGPVFGVFGDTDDVGVNAALVFTEVMRLPQDDLDRLRSEGELDGVIRLYALLQVAPHHVRRDAVIPVHLDRRDRNISQTVSHIQDINLAFRLFLYSRDPAVAVRKISPEIPVASPEREAQKPDYYDKPGYKACNLDYVLHVCLRCPCPLIFT